MIWLIRTDNISARSICDDHGIHGVSLPTLCRLCFARSLSRVPFWCSWLTSMVAWIRLRSVPWPIWLSWCEKLAWVLLNLFSPGAEANKWIVWANATLDPICFKDREGAKTEHVAMWRIILLASWSSMYFGSWELVTSFRMKSTCMNSIVTESYKVFSFYVKSHAFSVQEDGNGRVLDTGLRGDPPALEVLDGLLEANEFLLGSGEVGRIWATAGFFEY